MARRPLDPARTREKVLESATRLFSANGFAATSINDIAKDAGVTKSLVLYHFSSKEDLRQKAIEILIGPLVQTMVRYGNGEPDLTFLGILRERFDLMRANPASSRMIRWMSLDSAPLPTTIRGVVPKVVARAMGEFSVRGLPPGVPPQMLAAILLCACDGWFSFRHLYSAASDLDLVSIGADERFFESLLTLLPGEVAHE